MWLMLGIPKLHIFCKHAFNENTIYREYFSDSMKTNGGEEVLQFQRVTNGEYQINH